MAAVTETVPIELPVQEPGMSRVKSIRSRFENIESRQERQQLRRGLEFERQLVQHQIHQLEAKMLAEIEQTATRRSQLEKLVSNRVAAQARRASILEERRQREEAEAAERKRPCTACMEDIDSEKMLLLECEHWFCKGCINDAVRVAVQSRTALSCCGKTVDIYKMEPFIRAYMWLKYETLLLELSTPDPMYCANLSCGAFLRSADTWRIDIAWCSQCHTQTCRKCRSRAHGKDGCETDPNMMLARTMAKERGWKECPRCKNIIERNQGCLHMTCRCGSEFCYRCGQPWRLCQSACRGR